jgi:aconitate hydratase
VLEVLAHSGALVDLIATGARLIEPDQRLLSGELYPPGEGCISIRTFDPAPGVPEAQRSLVASAETLAYAVATGEIGDPRSFKRPVRVTVPRALPTDDVLVTRKQKKAKAGSPQSDAAPSAPPTTAWDAEASLKVSSAKHAVREPTAFVAADADAVRWAAQNAGILAPPMRVLIAPSLPAGVVSLFAGLGVLTLLAGERELQTLNDQMRVVVPKPDGWRTADSVPVQAGSETLALRWPARGIEREWALRGSAVPNAATAKR